MFKFRDAFTSPTGKAKLGITVLKFWIEFRTYIQRITELLQFCICAVARILRAHKYTIEIQISIPAL